MLTKEWLLQQREVYQKQMADALNLANANMGAIEAIDAVLKKWAEENSEDK